MASLSNLLTSPPWVGDSWGSSSLYVRRCIDGFRAPRIADDPTIDGHDPYFNEDEYTDVLHPAGSAAAGPAGRSDPHRAVAAGARAVRPARRDHGDRHANHVPQHRCSRKSDGASRAPTSSRTTPWPGQGPRPLIVYGPGTQGQGDQCAPSRQFNQGIHWSPWLDLAFNYEELFVVDDGGARVRDRDDRLPGPRHPGPAHLREPGRRRATRCSTPAAPRNAAARHVAGSPMGPWRSGGTRKVAEPRPRRRNWRRRTPPNSTSSAPTRARRPPT